jgi:Zn-dependent peptidase ImmA (M78 family)
MDLVRELGREIPVNLPRIIRALGIRYDERFMPADESGRIERDDDGYMIVVNATEGEQRRRFTAAHELAHYLLHRDLLHREGHLDRLFGPPGTNPSSPFTPRHEVQANRLAADLLMPADAVRAYEEMGLEVGEMARRFGVSPAAMRIRLQSLGLLAPERGAPAHF